MLYLKFHRAIRETTVLTVIMHPIEIKCHSFIQGIILLPLSFARFIFSHLRWREFFSFTFQFPTPCFPHLSKILIVSFVPFANIFLSPQGCEPCIVHFILTLMIKVTYLHSSGPVKSPHGPNEDK